MCNTQATVYNERACSRFRSSRRTVSNASAARREREASDVIVLGDQDRADDRPSPLAQIADIPAPHEPSAWRRYPCHGVGCENPGQDVSA